jgi:triacylglycerol lipase
MKEIQEYTTKMNSGNAYWMARLSKEVYDKTSNSDQKPDENGILNDIMKDDPGFISVIGFNKNSSQAAVIEHEKYICMAFRGTNELADWIDNINAISEKALFGEFHRGFYQSVMDIWGPMYQTYRSLMDKERRPIFFTGHSLGGAMATVAASIFVFNDWPFTSVYTFGQPRVMSRETSRIFNAECKNRFYRFQNNNDVVTRAPARLMGYSHVGSFIYISEEKKLHDDPGFWFKFVDYFDGALNDLRIKGIDGIKDHNIEKYIEAVESWNCDWA